jgi:hypothetical protein
MRGLLIAAVLLGALVIGAGINLWFSPIGAASPYHRFNGRSRSYYSNLAHACDTVLREHTNFSRFSGVAGEEPRTPIWMDPDGTSWIQTRLPVADPSLSEAIRALHPHEILLAPKRVWIGIGARPDWAIYWQQDDVETNLWTLTSNGEGLERRLYVERR